MGPRCPPTHRPRASRSQTARTLSSPAAAGRRLGGRRCGRRCSPGRRSVSLISAAAALGGGARKRARISGERREGVGVWGEEVGLHACASGVPAAAGRARHLTYVIVVSVIIEFLMDDVFFYFKRLLLLSRDQPVRPAQDHLEMVGRIPDGETARGCSSLMGLV